jgi:hypothetical protein
MQEIQCQTIMRAKVFSECPNDPSDKIVYDLLVSPAVFMPVEELIAILQQAQEKPMFQEELTVYFAEKLKPFMARVTMRGVHLGIELTTLA